MKTTLFLSIFTMLFIQAFTQPEPAFQYVESSTGMSYPDWESGPTELEFADINMDGYIDILSIGDHGSPYINTQQHGIMVYFGDGTGSWSAEMTGNFGYGGIAIGDVNNDGYWDVGYGMHHAYSTTDLGDQLLEVALGDGTGINWTAWDDGLATNGESWGLFGTDFADVDNDGDLDIGTNSFGSGSGLHVYINQGDGTWIQSFGILEGNSSLRFVFGDINNDGNADFVVTHDAGIAFFGNGDGTYYNADYNLPNYGYPMNGTDLGDIDKDGGQDLVYVNPYGGILVWLFDEDNTTWIEGSGNLPATGDYQIAQLCDLNSDGIMDIAAFGNAVLTVWKGTLTDSPSSITWTQVFTTTTSNNGNCGAFRVGGDVDRNGYPDMTLVEKEGSWPNDLNHLKCFKETTQIFLYHIKSVFPKGNEVFKQGSAQFTDWISAVPVSSTSQVKIEYSLRGRFGPFANLTYGTANSGRYQWIIPQTISTNNCFLKYTLVEDNDTLVAMTPGPFTILGDNGIEADFFADSLIVQVGSPVQFTDQSIGLLTSWEWDFDNNDTVDATDRNPAYAYSQPGEFTVKLTVSDGNNNASETKMDYITVYSTVNVTETETIIPEMIISPNPSNGEAIVSYGYQTAGPVSKHIEQITLVITDIHGNIISILNKQAVKPGNYIYYTEPSISTPGIYFCILTVGEKRIAKKMIVY